MKGSLGLFLALTLAACGGTGSTGGADMAGGSQTCNPTCKAGFVCKGTTCDLDPTGQWVITVTTGRVNEKKADGTTWDIPGGLPDPLVCLTLNGTRRCTATKADTLMPTWNEPFSSATATALQVGFKVEFLDEDIGTSESICPTATQAISTEDFQNGTWTSQCATGSFSATLAVR